jgi:WD40 repeat protein
MRIVLYENFLFSASADSTAAQFDKTSGNLIRKFSGSSPWQVVSVAVSSDGQWLFTGSQNTEQLLQWKVSDGNRVRTMEGISFG